MFIKEVLSYFSRSNLNNLSKAESFFVEATIFLRIYEEFFEILKTQYNGYLRLIKTEFGMENEMMEANFLKFLVNDILSTNDYTLEGIANFIRMPIDAVLEVASGINNNPSLMLATKLIKLHINVRKDLYGELMKKIISDFDS
ncbi:MAG: hypothetical protein ACD_46C00144G0002 [uncultured bacterium]|nr:MAG: hypothetical protein ACD_46C00144G0002 [uncultured bacterium]